AHHQGGQHDGALRHSRSRRGDLSRRPRCGAASQSRPHRANLRRQAAAAARSALDPRASRIPASPAGDLRFHQRRRAVKFLKGAALPVALLVLWEIGMRVSHVESDSLAPPSAIVLAFYEAIIDGTILQRTGETLFSVLCGLGVGGGLALVFSVMLG